MKSRICSLIGLLCFFATDAGGATKSEYLGALLHESRVAADRDDSRVIFSTRGNAFYRLLAEIDRAEKSIDVAFFSMASDVIVDALLRKASQGVRVRILDDSTQAGSNYYLRMRVADVGPPNLVYYPVVNLRGGFFHHKLMVFDGQKVWVGTANASNQGLTGGLDYLVSFTTRDIVAPVVDEFEENLTAARELCVRLAVDASACADRPARYPPEVHDHFFRRRANPALFKADNDCQRLAAAKDLWFLTPASQPTNRMLRCLSNDAVGALLRAVAAGEKFVDGESVASVVPHWSKPDTQRGQSDRVYFAPEDNPSRRILEHLHALRGRDGAFVYVSASQLTDGRLLRGLRRLQTSGVDVRVVIDRVRFLAPEYAAGHESLVDLAEPPVLSSTSESVVFVDNMFADNPVDFSHHRFMLTYEPGAGEMTVITGTGNFSDTAFAKSDEVFFLTQDREVVAEFGTEFLTLMLAYGGMSSGAFADIEERVQDAYQRTYGDVMPRNPKYLTIAISHDAIAFGRADVYVSHAAIGTVAGISLTSKKTVVNLTLSPDQLTALLAAPRLRVGVANRLQIPRSWDYDIDLPTDELRHGYGSIIYRDLRSEP